MRKLGFLLLVSRHDCHDHYHTDYYHNPNYGSASLWRHLYHRQQCPYHHCSAGARDRVGHRERLGPRIA
jgi:hypothetical protein